MKIVIYYFYFAFFTEIWYNNTNLRGGVMDNYRYSLLVANQLLNKGLSNNPKRRILEISEKSTGRDSLTYIFKGMFDETFLLSREFDKKEAEKFGIKGAKGRLYSPFGDISIKTEKGYPNIDIDTFDTVVVQGFSNDLLLLPGLSQEIFAGYKAKDNEKSSDELRYVYKLLYQILYLKRKDGYVYSNNESFKNRCETCLIYKK